MKKIMILGASKLQLPAILKARDMGYWVLVVDEIRTSIGFKFADKSLHFSTNDSTRILEAARTERINGIMTLATDMPVRVIATVSEELNLIGLTEETARIATDKFKMRQCLAENRLPVPLFFKAASIEEYRTIIARFSDSYIVKPVDNSGGRGVFLVDSHAVALKAFDHAKRYSRSGEVIIEEFMSGREISVETLSYKSKTSIIAITDKQTTGPPYFVEIGHTQPAIFDQKSLQKITQLTVDSIQAIGLKNGPAHTEIIITRQGPKIVEIGARLGGGFISSHLVPLSTGVDLIENSIKIAMNESPNLKMVHERASAIRFCRTPVGWIKSIGGIDDAKSILGISEIGFFKKEGDIINDLQSGLDRVGYVIASGTSIIQVINSCQKAIDLLDIEIVESLDG